MKRMPLIQRQALPRSQRGVALAISLVLLAAITILGVSTLSGTRLNEQIASNTQQKSIVFEAAESAIESVTNYADLYQGITANMSASGNNPVAYVFPDEESQLNDGYDLSVEGKGIDIEGELAVQYCGEVQALGTSLSAALDSGHVTGILVDISGKASIKNSSARADHLRRVSFKLPQTGRTGNCTVRY